MNRENRKEEPQGKTPYTPTPAGIRLRDARLAAGFIEQTELAAASGVGALTINRVERGRGPLSKATAAKLAPYVRRSEAWLLYGAEEQGTPHTPRTPPAAVRQYLANEAWGRDVSPQVAKMLEQLDYTLVGIPNPTPKDVHRVREMIEINLTIARQRRR